MRDIMPSKSLIIHEYSPTALAPSSSRSNISAWHAISMSASASRLALPKQAPRPPPRKRSN